MTAILFDFVLDGPEATRDLAIRMAGGLVAGDTILLEGDIGAGKTHFARSLIQSIQLVREDVPSPTYTLVQTYETTRGEVVHADLYRITGPGEIAELGLFEAFGSAICLVEWPDRLGAEAPETALTIRLEAGTSPDSRRVAAIGDRDIWGARLEDLAHV